LLHGEHVVDAATTIGRFEVKPSQVVQIRTRDIKVDAKRFQFKLNTDSSDVWQ
jgi:hypothetical protein